MGAQRLRLKRAMEMRRPLLWAVRERRALPCCGKVLGRSEQVETLGIPALRRISGAQESNTSLGNTARLSHITK